MYKTIVPNLISVDTDLDKLNGFVMCQDFNFFPKTKNRLKYHFTLKLVKEIDVPTEYDFRSEYYVKKGDVWYFSRNIFFWHPSFKFDQSTKTLSFNRDYLLLPISLGGIFTLGEHLSNLIDFGLFINDFVIMRGIAFQKDEQVTGISAPGFNGKTTLLKKVLTDGAEYLAEDYLIIDTKRLLIYPTCPLTKENFWRRRKITSDFSDIISKKVLNYHPLKLDKLILLENTLNKKIIKSDRSVEDFLLLNSLYFINNLFIKSIIFNQSLTLKVFDTTYKLASRLKKANILLIYNFDDTFLNTL